MSLLNDPQVRAHLVDHPAFDSVSLEQWIQEKMAVDATPRFRVRAIRAPSDDDALVGWCGLQPDFSGGSDGVADLAIVLAPSHWGLGRLVFREMLGWASELGHQEVKLHLLESRREYRALRRKALSVVRSEWAGRHFVTYRFAVPDALANDSVLG